MAKKKNQVPVTAQVAPQRVQEKEAPQWAPKEQWNIYSFKVQAIILGLVGLIFYCNTFGNNWAYDDQLVIIQNEYVQQGIAGIPKILGKDAFDSYTQSQNEESNQLTGGRYRPLSMVTFAVEQQLLGLDRITYSDTSKAANTIAFKAKQAKLASDMHVRHVVNVLLYILSIVAMLYLLRTTILPKMPLAAFLAALIFVIHPIHTEVVANVKSRDEILSFLFICLTFILASRYLDTRKIKDLVLACACSLLAMLSKEYGVVLIVLIPLAIYIFRNYTVKQSVQASLIYLVPLGIYAMMRFSAVKPATEIPGGDIMNNPYAYVTGIQKIATEIAVLLNYLQLLVFPHPLSSDYTYNQIPYVDFGNIKVWLSLIVHCGLLWLMVQYIQKRHVLGFAIAFYFVFLALICNIFVNIGAPMGERLIYHSSLGFAICIAFLLEKGYFMIQQHAVAKTILATFMGVILVLCGYATIARNADWSSNAVLFLKDVATSPNSVIANTNAGMACIEHTDQATDSVTKAEWYNKAIPYLTKAISINNFYVVAHLNRGICYYKLGDMERAAADCDSVEKFFPNLPAATYLSYVVSSYYDNMAIAFANKNDQVSAIANFLKSIAASPTNADLYYNLAYAYCRLGRYQEGRSALIRGLQIKPDHAPSQQLLNQVNGILGAK